MAWCLTSSLELPGHLDFRLDGLAGLSNLWRSPHHPFGELEEGRALRQGVLQDLCGFRQHLELLPGGIFRATHVIL